MFLGAKLISDYQQSGLLKGIKHSTQIKLFLKVTWCPRNSNWCYIGQ